MGYCTADINHDSLYYKKIHRVTFSSKRVDQTWNKLEIYTQRRPCAHSHWWRWLVSQEKVEWLAQNQAQTAAGWTERVGPVFCNCLCRTAIAAATCSTDTTVYRTTRTWIWVTNFHESHLTMKHAKMTPSWKTSTIWQYLKCKKSIFTSY